MTGTDEMFDSVAGTKEEVEEKRVREVETRKEGVGGRKESTSILSLSVTENANYCREGEWRERVKAHIPGIHHRNMYFQSYLTPAVRHYIILPGGDFVVSCQEEQGEK